MTHVSFGFDPPELAEHLWWLVALLLVVEVGLWVRRGSAERRGRRVVIGLVGLGALFWLVGQLGWWGHSRGAFWAVLALCWLAVRWARRAYRHATRPMGALERRGLLLLRVVALAGIGLLLARPVLRWTQTNEDRGTIVMLDDDSRSMTVRDVPGDGGALRSRVEELEQIVSAHRKTLDRIAAVNDVQGYAFATAVRPAALGDVTGDGQYTAMAQAVREAVERASTGGRRVVGVLLMTDGGENFSSVDPMGVASELNDAGIALWVVGLGRDVPTGMNRGVVARRLVMPARIGVFNTLSIRGEFLALGLDGERLRAELRVDGKQVAEQTLTPAGARAPLEPRFTYVPERAGLLSVEVLVEAPMLDAERRETRIVQYVHVIDDAVPVLYVDRPRYERAAIARALEPAAELRVTKVAAGKSEGMMVNRLPRDIDVWCAYDVIILGDVEAGAVYKTQLRAIAEAVRECGAGLLVLGGDRGLGDGVYEGTPLEAVLPISAGVADVVEGPVAIRPTRTGAAHPICSLSDEPDGGVALWASLPELPLLYRVGGVKPGAAVLLATPEGIPVLVVQEAGRGRTAALMVDSTWEWPLGVEGGGAAHARFWRQLVLWLANRRPGLWVATDRPRYSLPRLANGVELVTVEAGLVTAGEGAAHRPSKLRGRAQGPNGEERLLSFVPRGDHYEAHPTIASAGRWAVRVEAEVDGAAAEPAETVFFVESPDIEMQDATANFELLERMAAATGDVGGAFVQAEDAGRLFEEILARPFTVRRTLYETTDLMEHANRPLWWMVAGALVVEWLVRKRRGLA